MNWTTLLQKQPEQITIEFSSGGRGVVVHLPPDGQVVARSYGGPRRHMGRLTNLRADTVPYWEMGHSTIRERLLRALLAEGFPFTNDEEHWLVPGEVQSSMRLYIKPSDACVILMPHRFFDAHPPLQELAGELDSFCYKTQKTPPTNSMPNPELHLWK